jgi:hypothetical protein
VLTAKDIQKILKVGNDKSYEIINKLKRNNKLEYDEVRIPKRIIKEHYHLSDEEIEEALQK